ncbi:MAG TPA: hypothetical protein VFV23_09530 [Verrucomicrobiae bacterium]|nr:hypothetical protein [Verrucomicrobiae bacterium]
MNPKGFLLIFAGGWLALNSSLFAQTWVQTSAPSNHWMAIASTADGSKLFAVARNSNRIFISTNGGVNWVSNSIGNFGAKVAVSADGNNIAIGDLDFSSGGDSAIAISTNAGATWYHPTVFLVNAPQFGWGGIAMSADGTKLIASVNQSTAIWTSTNSGISWAKNNVTFSSPYGVAISPDGNRMIVAGQQGKVYVSTDGGGDWITNNIGSASDFPGVASSADGQKLIFGSGHVGGLLYRSTDSGLTWTSNNLNQVWNSMASSVDGNKLIAGGSSALYT